MTTQRNDRWPGGSATAVRRRALLYTRLAGRFRLARQTITLPRSATCHHVFLPAAFDPLLDAAAADPEENLPYWALIWPSGIALADHLLAHTPLRAGQRVLELGCGLGVTASAALLAGVDLTVTDYAPPALLLCRLNTLENTWTEPRALQLNWRQPSAAFSRLARGQFSAILAADVLYEARDIEPLLTVVTEILVPGGILWLAEPGRPVAHRFITAALERGWADEVTHDTGPWPSPADQGVSIRLHRLVRPN